MATYQPHLIANDFLSDPPGGPGKPAQPLPRPTMSTSYNQWTPMQKMAVPGSTNKSSTPAPRRTQLPGAIATYESMANEPIYGLDPRAGVQPQPAINRTTGGADSWRDRLYSERYATSQRGGGYTSGTGTQQKQGVPVSAIPVPDMPEYKAPEYAPPGEDPNAYSKARKEAMAPGLRSLREGTREAISESQSLDNPNARSMFVRNALKGYGQGLESVAAGAAREGRAEAGRKRSEQLRVYDAQYAVKSDTYKQNYQNEINKIAQEFAQQQNIAQQQADAGIAPPRAFGDSAAFAAKWRQ